MLTQSMFTSRLRSILSDNSCRRMLSGKTSGRLDNARLAGLFAARQSPGRRAPVFAVPEVRSDKAYHVGLLIDASGSMSGSRMIAAYAAAHGIAVALKNAGATMSCATFNAEYKPLSIAGLLRGDIKIWRAYSNDTCEKYERGENFDATALALMHRTVAAVPDARRLIIVFSDGQPTSDGSDYQKHVDGYKKKHVWFDDQPKALRRIVSKCEADGIAVLGVGIESDCVRRFYKRSVVVNELDTLYNVVLTEIAKFVRRGR